MKVNTILNKIWYLKIIEDPLNGGYEPSIYLSNYN